MRKLQTTFLLTLLSVAPIQSVHALTPLESSCVLARNAVEKGADGVQAWIDSMMDQWPNELQLQSNVIVGLFSQHAMLRGDVFRVLKIADYTEEHLIVWEIKDQGILYLDLTYESVNHIMHVTRIEMRSPFVGLLAKRLITRSPEKLTCE